MPTRPEAVRKLLGFRLKELRSKAGFTQDEFAAKLEMLQPNYARIEQGRLDLRLSTLCRLADALQVDIGILFELPKQRKVTYGRPRKD